MDSKYENIDPVGFVRPEDRAVKVICVANMTDTEREEFFKGMEQKARETHEENKRCGEYKRCRKTDWCKLAREKKEAEDKKLKDRNIELEKQAKQLEQEFADYKKITEARFDKIAEMLSTLK